MKFQQIRSATSIVTFANRRFLIDPMLSAQGTYPAVPDTTSTGRGNPDCDLPCPIQDLFNVDAVIVTHLHFDHFDKAAAELLPKTSVVFSERSGGKDSQWFGLYGRTRSCRFRYGFQRHSSFSYRL